MYLPKRISASWPAQCPVPASYTLGLIEAMLVGVPVVSIGPEAWMGPDRLFEGAELAGLDMATDDPALARAMLSRLLQDPVAAIGESAQQRSWAQALFDVRVVGAQWRDLLGAP